MYVVFYTKYVEYIIDDVHYPRQYWLAGQALTGAAASKSMALTSSSRPQG